MTKTILFFQNLLSSPKFYLPAGIVGVTGMVASSFLFVKGVKEVKEGIKNKNWKTIGKGALKTAPMVVCAASTILILVFGYRSTSQVLTKAAEAMGRLSSVAAPVATIAGETMNDVADKAADAVADAIKSDDKKPSSEESKSEEPKKDVPKDDNVEIVDTLSGQHFFSTINKVEECVNVFNNRLLDGDFHPVNDFYYLIGLPENVLGEQLGWKLDENNNGMIVVRFIGDILNGKPIVKMVFRVYPKSDSTRDY